MMIAAQAHWMVAPRACHWSISVAHFVGLPLSLVDLKSNSVTKNRRGPVLPKQRPDSLFCCVSPVFADIGLGTTNWNLLRFLALFAAFRDYRFRDEIVHLVWVDDA